MTDLVRSGGGDLAPAAFDNLYRQARALAASGLFQDTRQAEQAFAKIIVGRSLGLDAGASLTSLHVIDGKVEASANLQAAMLRAYRGPDGERYDYRAHVADDAVSIDVLRRAPGGEWELQGVSTFTIGDAEQAGLAGRANYKKFPRSMLFARALSNAVAWYAPEVTFGQRVYAPGEVSGEQREVAGGAPEDVRERLDAPAEAPARAPEPEPELDEAIVDAEVVEATLDQPHPRPVPETEAHAETAGAEAPVDAEVVPAQAPADRVIAAYKAAGRPTTQLWAVLNDDEVDLSGGLLAAVRAITDSAQADRIVAALTTPTGA